MGTYLRHRGKRRDAQTDSNNKDLVEDLRGSSSAWHRARAKPCSRKELASMRRREKPGSVVVMTTLAQYWDGGKDREYRHASEVTSAELDIEPGKFRQQGT